MVPSSGQNLPFCHASPIISRETWLDLVHLPAGMSSTPKPLQTSSTITDNHYNNSASIYRNSYKMLANRSSFLFCLAVGLLVLAAASKLESDVSHLQHANASSTTTPPRVTNSPPTTSVNNIYPTTMISDHRSPLLKITRATIPPPDISLHPIENRSAQGFRIFGYILAGLFVGTIFGLIIRIYFRQWVEVLCLALRDGFSRGIALERRRWYGR